MVLADKRDGQRILESDHTVMARSAVTTEDFTISLYDVALLVNYKA
jgi:hypothetical protein